MTAITMRHLLSDCLNKGETDMKKLNLGNIYTNDNCVACNRCITACSIIGANIFVIKDGKAMMTVNGDKCIHCGRCVKACNHDARKYRDDSERFINDLKNGKKISILLSPSFLYLYGDYAGRILGYLKSIGAGNIYDAGYGAEISVWAHLDYLLKHENDADRAYIGQSCSSINNYLEHYDPKMLKNLIPVHSPLACTVIYARKYLNETAELAYIGPCTSKKDELCGIKMGVEYNVTFSQLIELFEGIDYDGQSYEFTSESLGFGRLISLAGGFMEIMQFYFPKHESLLAADGLEELSSGSSFSSEDDNIFIPRFVELISCHGGCVMGPGVSKDEIDYKKVYSKIYEARQNSLIDDEGRNGYLKNRKDLNDHFAKLNPDDFAFRPISRYQQSFNVSEYTYDEIYKAMHKDTEVKRTINCGSCGYTTCKEMARAIAYGYNKMENCIHYMNDELRYRYYIDDLTKLYNKNGFINACEKVLKDNPDKTYVLALASINQMNVINDLCGFEVGDKVISYGAEVAKQFVGEGGVAARYAGAKYLLLFEFDYEHKVALGNTRTHDLSSFGIAFPVSYKAGLYLIKERNEPLDHMINYAILTNDKITPGVESTILVYDGDLKEKLVREALVASEMYKALDNHEFVAYYQPQYDHITGKMVAAEMLCRWIKSDGTMVSPGIFIPIFEKNGFIYNLDKYMWEAAFKTIRKWLDDDIEPVPISVNISRISIIRSDFVAVIEDLRMRYMIPPEYLHFEVTESAYSDSQSMIINRINMIRAMGYKVAMDDFGSGYSSLNTLKDVPIDILKLDMGFLRGSNVERGERILEGVIRMVENLNLDMVSEGVETREQADFLTALGCNVIQGYYYARPMPQIEYEKRLMD